MRILRFASLLRSAASRRPEMKLRFGDSEICGWIIVLLRGSDIDRTAFAGFEQLLQEEIARRDGPGWRLASASSVLHRNSAERPARTSSALRVQIVPRVGPVRRPFCTIRRLENSRRRPSFLSTKMSPNSICAVALPRSPAFVQPHDGIVDIATMLRAQIPPC
jgi:hypothetical protein